MDEPLRIRRRIRRRVDGDGVHLQVAADINVVATTGGSTSSRQQVRVRQGRSDRSAPEPNQKEHP